MTKKLGPKARRASGVVLKITIPILILSMYNYTLPNEIGTSIAQDYSAGGGKANRQPNYSQPTGMSADLQGLNRTVQHGITAIGLELDLIHDGVDNTSSKTGVAPDINMWVLEMMEKGLDLSAKHQSRFNDRKHLLAREFPTTMLYSTNTSSFGAYVLNDKFAYRHIWKSGGTTIEIQTGNEQCHLMKPKIKNRKLMTFVRDPIDHFLSGWAECGYWKKREKRGPKEEPYDFPKEEPYDFRVKRWLNQIKTRPTSNCECYIHSFPQGTFLLDANRTVYSNLEFIGDLREIAGVLELVGFKFNNSLEGGRIAGGNKFIQTYYPRRKDLLSNDTMRAICDFVALDYFLFDFELPDVCKDLGAV